MKFIKSTQDVIDQQTTISRMVNERGLDTQNENEAAAKTVSFGSIIKFFVRSSKRQRRLFNPIIDKIDQRSVPRTEFEFVMTETNKDCYDSYCEYLKNRSSYMLTKADMFSKR